MTNETIQNFGYMLNLDPETIEINVRGDKIFVSGKDYDGKYLFKEIEYTGEYGGPFRSCPAVRMKVLRFRKSSDSKKNTGEVHNRLPTGKELERIIETMGYKQA